MSLTSDWIRREIDRKIVILNDEVLAGKISNFVYLISFKPWVLYKDSRLAFVFRYLSDVHAKFPSAGKIFTCLPREFQEF